MPEPSLEGAIQPIARALEILCALNRQPYATLQELHDLTALPKPTLHRLLATLRVLGYVDRNQDRGVYRLSAKVQLLSAGFGERSLITTVGSAILRAATREIQWPLALGTLDGTEIVVRYSTMPYSPCAVRTTTVNNRHKLFGSAMGTAYLAHCGAEERGILLERTAQTDESIAHLARDEDHVRDLVLRVRSRGFGLRRGTERDESATMAVPIVVGDHLAGVVSLTMFRRSLTSAASRRYLPVLNDVAKRVAERVGQAGHDE